MNLQAKDPPIKHTLKCVPVPGGSEVHECSNYARWHVWYVNFPLYTYMCDFHASLVLLNDQNGWPVEKIQLISNSFLPDEDRAKHVTRAYSRDRVRYSTLATLSDKRE